MITGPIGIESVSDEVESRRSRQRPVAVLTLLFGLLVGFAGPGAQVQADPGTARLGNGEILRTASGLRLAGRSNPDKPDDGQLALVPPAPRIVTEQGPARPADAVTFESFSAAPSAPNLHYRARAPPAA